MSSVVASVAKVRTCPDQYVGLLRNLAETDDFPQRLPANARPQGQATIILIIESPHVKEYQGNPGPAKGKTGENIRAHLRSVLSTYALDGYGLVLMNAVRHQSSLGAPTRLFRDKVFRLVWSSFGRSDFKERLANVYSDGDLLVNACTKGNTKVETRELRRIVEAAIQEVRPTGSDAKVHHPSSWHFAKNRAGRWQ